MTDAAPRPVRVRLWAAVTAAVLLGVPLLLLGTMWAALNTNPGRHEAELLTARLTGGMVRIAGLRGTLPQAPRLDRIEVRDAKGVWLTARDITLNWAPLALIGREARIGRLAVGQIAVLRAPVAASPAKPTRSAGFGVPVAVDVDALAVADLSLGPAIAGRAAHLSLGGQAHVRRFAAGTRPIGSADLVLQRLDSPGQYSLHTVLTHARITTRLDVREPAHGLASTASGLPDLGRLEATSSLDGPWTAAVLHLAVAAGQMQAAADGTIDLEAGAAAVAVTAAAPAMTPAPGLGWSSIAVAAHVAGPFARPAANGTVDISALSLNGVRIGHVAGRVTADTHTARLVARVETIVLAPPNEGLLAQGPLNLAAVIDLDAPTRPVSLHFDHPLLNGAGTAVLRPEVSARLVVAVPDLGTLARPAGRDVAGNAGFTLRVARHQAASRIDLDAAMSVTGGRDAPPAARGDTRLGATVTLDGADIVLSRLLLDGATIHASATGSRHAGQVAADWALHTGDLRQIVQNLRGAVDVTGHLAGTQQDFAAGADLSGTLGSPTFSPAPLRLSLRATGLPGKPAGHLSGTAMLAGSDLHLDMDATRDADGALHVAINQAGWKSAAIAGVLTLPQGAALPIGHLAVTMTRLDDLRPLLGQPISGSVSGRIDLPRTGTGSMHVEARNAGLPGKATLDRALLDARITDPAGARVIGGSLTATGLRAGSVNGEATVTANGPLATLGLRLTAALRNLAGADAAVTAAATLDTPAHALTLASLRAAWHDETLTLAAPARLTYAPGVAVDRLRLIATTAGATPAALDLAGRLSPDLAVSLTASGITPALARPFAPDLQADGVMRLDARLGGTAASPNGTIHLVATGLHVRGGPARGLPPADLRAELTVAGRAGRLDAALDAGTLAHLGLRGAVPLAAGGAMALRADGAVGLALLDPILTAGGRRLRGTVTLDAGISGTPAAPNAEGTLRWSGGELQDYAQGVHITAIDALIAATGDTVRIERFAGKAGGGTIGVAGSIGLHAPQPVDLTITADNARPITSDLVTATLDAALTVRGTLADRVAASGRIHVRRADIQVPDTLPTSVAVLDVRRPGEHPPARRAGPGLQIPLDITLDAPQQVFVRGHGLDAELGGSLHLGGTAAAPQTAGAIELRRGAYSLAGQTLTFTSGDISFNGAQKIDPALNLIATSASADLVATLTVGGYASAPKISLTSVPDRPQDEVLAALLFHQSATSLSPFQLAQIAAALVQVSGVGGGGLDPISRLRNGLGLDRLSVGSSGTGSSASTAVEAGRYVRPGVYVGAKQGTSGAQTQAEVQIDIFRGLKLQTDVGSGTGGNTVGLTYQFQY